MENLPKLRDNYHYRVVTVHGAPYLAICSKKIKGIFKKRAVRVIEFKVSIKLSSSVSVMEDMIYRTAIAMKAVRPEFFLHDLDDNAISQLNSGLEAV